MLRITALNSHTNTQFQFSATPNHICFGITYKFKTSESDIYLFAFSKYAPGEAPHHITRRSDGEHFGDFEDLDQAERTARKIAMEKEAELMRYAKFTWDNFRFMPSMDLEIGMMIPILDKKQIYKAKITNITEEHYDGLVYDLDIPEARNFAANGVLVHNSIYAWRGADDPFILLFEKQHPDAQIVRLENLSRAALAVA